MAEPLYCSLCGAEDWECGHKPWDSGAPEPHHEGPAAYCEVGCFLYTGERCRFCTDVPAGVDPWRPWNVFVDGEST